MYSNTYNLNMVPGGMPLVINISQYDVGLREFHFVPYSTPGQMTYVSGAVATLEATKPDGYAVVQECTYNQDGSIDYTVQEQLAAVAGKVRSKIILRLGTDVIGSATVLWIVDKAGVTDGAIMSDSDISGMEAYVNQLKTLVGTPVAVATAAGMTDQSTIYLYTGSETGYTTNHWYYYNGTAWVDGGLYGGSDIEVDSALSSSSTNPVQNKVITGEITELKDDLTATDIGLKKVISYFETESDTVTETSNIGYKWDYTNGTLIENAGTTAWEFDADELTDYVLQGLRTGTEAGCAVIFINTNGNIISLIQDATQESGHKLPITTPLGCVKVKYTSYTNATWDAAPIKISVIPISEYAPTIAANAAAVKELGFELPDYYFVNDYITDKVNTIMDNTPLHGVTFAFITDFHFGANQLNSLPLLNYLRKNTSISAIISGGDYVKAYGDNNDVRYAYNMALRYAKALYPDWFSIRGNHDFTIRTSSSVSTGITWGDAITVNGIIRPMADWRYEVLTPEVSFLNETYKIYTNYNWILTNEKEKVKIVYFADFDTTNVNTYWGVGSSHINAYLRYFYQMLKSTDGYKVVVVSHAPMTPSLSSGLNTNAIKVIEAFAAKTSITQGAYTFDFTQSTGELICALSGHGHKDQSILENGVLHISTTCDALYQDDGYGRTAGTVDEQAFDVFNIDTENRTIKITRIGAGSDREFTY